MRIIRSLLCTAGLLLSTHGCTIGDVGDGGQDGEHGDQGAGPKPSEPPTVDEAAEKYPDVFALWERSISRTCGPNNGVCHNSKQFPDLQTVGGFLESIGSRCNQIRTDPKAVNNLCEPSGDVLRIGAFESRIGQVTDSGAPESIVLSLHDPPPESASGTISIVRRRPGVPEVELALPAGAVVSTQPDAKTITLDHALLSDPEAAPGPFGGSLADFLGPHDFFTGSEAEIELGDPNGDGVFGADLGGAVITPGDPLRSYLFLRVIGPLAVGGDELTHVGDATSEEPQMPIANYQYWDIDNDVVALWCWIRGMDEGGANASAPIDYDHCDLEGLPEIHHQGGEATTFSSVYEEILVSNCAGPCHHEGTKESTTFVMGDARQTYDVLLGIAGTGPSNALGLPFVTPNAPEKSLLYLKITGEPSAGSIMPPGAQLAEGSVAAVETWIRQGAEDN